MRYKADYSKSSRYFFDKSSFSWLFSSGIHLYWKLNNMNPIARLFSSSSAKNNHILVKESDSFGPVFTEKDINIDKILECLTEGQNVHQFFLHNLKKFDQGYTSPDRFINDVFEASQIGSLYLKEISYFQFSYMFGIPILIVDELPWSNPADYVRLSGIFTSVGIVCKKSDNLIQTLRHEFAHAINDWLKKIGIFKIKIENNLEVLNPFQSLAQALSDKLTGADLIVRLRDEAIVALLIYPYELSKTDNQFLTRILLGVDRSRAETILGENIAGVDTLIVELKKISMIATDIDGLTEEVCQILLAEWRLSELVSMINFRFT
jgi:hypothetical protein